MNPSLAEQLFLIAFDPGHGKATANPREALPYGLAGAVVMDLVINHGWQLVDGKVVPDGNTGDPALDDALASIRADSKQRDVKHWVKKLAGHSANVEGKVVQQLLSQGVLSERDARVLGIKVRRYDLRDSSGRDAAMATLQGAVTSEASVDSSTASLVALANACGLVDRVVTKDQRSAARRRAKAIGQEDVASKAVGSAVQEVQAAVMAGVIAAIAASSVTSSGHGH